MNFAIRLLIFRFCKSDQNLFAEFTLFSHHIIHVVKIVSTANTPEATIYENFSVILKLFSLAINFMGNIYHLEMKMPLNSTSALS